MKSKVLGFPEGCAYFGPQIRIPRQAGWKRLETAILVNQSLNLVLKLVLKHLIRGLSNNIYKPSRYTLTI